MNEMNEMNEQLSFDPFAEVENDTEETPAKADAKDEKENFEVQLKELETILAKIEKGDQSLEETIRLFERGYALSQSCQKELEEMEERIKKIAFSEEGEIEELPFDI